MIVVNEVDSTNAYARRLLLENSISDSACIFARYQTLGRGQRGRIWQSDRNQNVLLSIVVEPKRWGYALSGQSFLMSCAVSLALVRCLADYANDYLSFKVKWPNDIYWRQQKIAGTLIENVCKGEEWKWAIIGIGLNVNQTKIQASGKCDATSLYNIIGSTQDVLLIARKVKKHILEGLYCVPSLIDYYTKKLLYYKGNEWKVIKCNDISYEVRISHLHEDGYIDMQTRQGERLLRISHEEIQW